MPLAAAYAACQRLAQAHYENFPVASRLLPPRMRPHIAAVYAFARVADDFADEGDWPAEARLARLDHWSARLAAAVAGRRFEGTAPEGTPEAAAEQWALMFEAIGHSIRTLHLSPALFEDLVSAFRQDVTVTRYPSWEAVLDYCRRSANPVGRLVLQIGGWRDPSLADASDAFCTALQLTNFWQDLAIDWRRGRLYVPEEAYGPESASLVDLDRATLSDAWRRALGSCAARTRALFDRGRPVCDGVTGRLRWELRLTWLGGTRILDELERSAFDVFRVRPALGLSDTPALAWRALTWTPVSA